MEACVSFIQEEAVRYIVPYSLFIQKFVAKIESIQIVMKQLSDITELFPTKEYMESKIKFASMPMPLRKCILRQEDDLSLFICNPRERASGIIETCCYDAEMDYHHCCPINEPRHMSYTSRITGSITAAVILLICITLLCIFSSRCPLRKAFLNRRSRGAAERMTYAEETPGD